MSISSMGIQNEVNCVSIANNRASKINEILEKFDGKEFHSFLSV
jgi:hypothetical protein